MNKKIIILVLILVFFYFKKKKFTNTIDYKKIYNGGQWNKYRLGDVFLQHLDYPHYDPNYDDNILYHKTEYKCYIANEYINKNNENQNYKLLNTIIDSKSKDKSDYPNTLFLHIRVGDILCDSITYVEGGGALYYAKKGDINWWNEIVEYIQINNISKVIIIAGSHTNRCLKESNNYILDRTDFLMSELPNLKIDYRIGQSPDDDVLICAYVKHFKTTGGGFGNLINDINCKIKEKL